MIDCAGVRKAGILAVSESLAADLLQAASPARIALLIYEGDLHLDRDSEQGLRTGG